jgi:hypothetical protein
MVLFGAIYSFVLVRPLASGSAETDRPLAWWTPNVTREDRGGLCRNWGMGPTALGRIPQSLDNPRRPPPSIEWESRETHGKAVQSRFW